MPKLALVVMSSILFPWVQMGAKDAVEPRYTVSLVSDTTQPEARDNIYILLPYGWQHYALFKGSADQRRCVGQVAAVGVYI